VLFNFHIFVNFQVFLYYFYFIPLWSGKVLCMSLIFLNVLRLVLWHNICFIRSMFHMYLRKMCILLLWGGIIYICLLGLFGLEYISSLLFPYWSSVSFFYLLVKVGKDFCLLQYFWGYFCRISLLQYLSLYWLVICYKNILYVCMDVLNLWTNCKESWQMHSSLLIHDWICFPYHPLLI
jgi:hypothetical protein